MTVDLLLLLGVLTACSLLAPAGPKIRAENVWSRPAKAVEQGHGQGMSGTGAVFMTLVNDGREDDRLVGAQTDVAEVVEIHRTAMDGEVMKMQPVSSVTVPAGERVELKPGGYHIMLIGLRRDLEVDDRFPVTLTLEESGTLTVEAKVQQP